jgi:hypothetical protein
MGLFKREIHHNYYEDGEAAKMREKRLQEADEEERELRQKQMEMEMAMSDFAAYKRYKREERRNSFKKVLLSIVIFAIFFGGIYLLGVLGFLD